MQVVHPDDLPRFRELDVVANCQTLWAQQDAQMDELTVPFLGQDRVDQMYPFGDLAASGAVLAMGSDWPVSTADPLAQMEVAVTRVGQEDRGDAAVPARSGADASPRPSPASPAARRT